MNDVGDESVLALNRTKLSYIRKICFHGDIPEECRFLGCYAV
jgi:hypothetical protein